MYEQHQTLILQNKLVKTELDTIKLEMKELPLYQIDKKLAVLEKEMTQIFEEKVRATVQHFGNQIKTLKATSDEKEQLKKHSITGNLHSLIKIKFCLSEGANP